MQIFTIDDIKFPDLMVLWNDAKLVGRYWKKGHVQLVSVTSQYVMISRGEKPEKIALKSALGLGQAEMFAIQFLRKENQRGNQVEITPEYQSQLKV